MSLFLAHNQQGYYVLKERVWIPLESGPGATQQRYIAYVGKEPRLTRSKALRICEEKGLDFEDLQGVNGLEIVDDGE